MGRSSEFVCHDCKKIYALGYGSYGTWCDLSFTIDEFIEKALERDINMLPKNINVLRCLLKHKDHKFDYLCEWNNRHENGEVWTSDAYGNDCELLYNIKDYKLIDLESIEDILK